MDMVIIDSDLRRGFDKTDQEIFCEIKPGIYLKYWGTCLPKQPHCDLLISDPSYSTDIKDRTDDV